MTSVTITLPLPNSGLSPNARKHWRAKSALTKKARQASWLKSLEAIGREDAPMWGKCKMSVKAYFKTIRFPDPTNLMASLKSYEDGFQDAGIIANDRDLWPERPEMFKDATNPRIEITIQPE